MSKIAEALEKAGRDGSGSRAILGAFEHEFLPPDQGGTTTCRNTGSASAERSPHRLGTESLDASLLVGVDDHLEPLLRPKSPLSEHYRALRSRLERLNGGARYGVIALTSAVKGEGKSLTATNLAIVLAQDATKKVLLVDCDLRSPRVNGLLGLPTTPGLVDHLVGGKSIREVIRRTALFGLSVVTAGTGPGHPAELLASPQFSQFLASCRGDFDHIILDTPPALALSDVGFLMDAVDGVLLVVRAHRTPKGLLREIVEGIPPEKRLGTVLNRSDSVGEAYGYGSRYGY